jgi:hypothetical protein
MPCAWRKAAAMRLSRIVTVLMLVFAVAFLEGCGDSASQGVRFAPRVDKATGGTGATSLVLADFNGDGKLDIAVSNRYTNTISVFLNQGFGRFSAPIITTVAALSNTTNPLGKIVAGDIDGDGKADLIVSGSNLGTVGTGSTGGIGTFGFPPEEDVVLLGNGDGTFSQGSMISNTGGFCSARLVDLNGDKHLDLVSGGFGVVSVALGNGDGSFQPAAIYSTVATTSSGTSSAPALCGPIEIGDVNGDGKLDVVGTTLDATGTNLPFSLFVLLGNGDGTFQAPLSQTLERPSTSLALADFNGDGKLDLLHGYPGAALMALGNGDGSFLLTAPNQQPVYSTNPDDFGLTTVRGEDMNGDGKPDALVADYNAGTLTIVLNNGSGFSDASKRYTYTINPGLVDMAVGDLNGDGLPDVVLLNGLNNQLSLFLSEK